MVLCPSDSHIIKEISKKQGGETFLPPPKNLILSQEWLGVIGREGGSYKEGPWVALEQVFIQELQLLQHPPSPTPTISSIRKPVFSTAGVGSG